MVNAKREPIRFFTNAVNSFQGFEGKCQRLVAEGGCVSEHVHARPKAQTSGHAVHRKKVRRAGRFVSVEGA